jgi:hypothetical protein
MIARLLRRLALKRQIDRDIREYIAPARKARQESAAKGQHTYWTKAGAQARKMFGETL